MSKTVDESDIGQDSLSAILRQLGFSAKVFFRDGYCGEWAVDTSGSTHAPFHLVCQGEGWLHSEGNEPQKLMPGQLAFFPNDAPHALAASVHKPSPNVINQPPPNRLDGTVTRLVCGYFIFDQRAAAPLLASLPDCMILDLSNSADPCSRDLVNLWIREAAQNNLGSDLAVDRLAELIFIHLLRVEIEQGRLQGVVGALGDPKLGQVLANVHRTPGANHQLPEMASAAGMSESAFTQRFKKRVGMTPGQYVKHWRMQTAASALRQTQKGVFEIATDAGYESEVAFRKAFSSHFEMAPGAYRRTHGGAN